MMKWQICLFSLALLVSLVVAEDLSANGVEFIKNHEGWRSCAYKDAVGLWTIGYGHLIVAGDGLCTPVVTTQCCITKEKGLQILTSDVKKGSKCVSRILNGVVLDSLSDNEFSAIVSWAYNIGCGNAASSTLIEKLNAGNKNDTCSELKRWVYGGNPKKVIPGLVNRRDDECQLFLTP